MTTSALNRRPAYGPARELGFRGAPKELEIRRHEGPDALLALAPVLSAAGFLPAPLAGMEPEFLAAGFEGETHGALVAYAAGRPVAYLSYVLTKIEFRPAFGDHVLGRFPCRQLRLFGYTGTQAASAPLLDGFFHALENARWDVMQVLELPLENPLAAHLVGAAGLPYGYSPTVNISETFQVGLAEDFESYLKCRFSKKTRYNLRREVRLLEDSAPGRVALKISHAPGQVADFFRDSAAVAGRSYKWRGRPNPMAATPRQLNKFSFLAARGRFRGYVLFIRDEPVAFCATTLRWAESFVEIVGHDARYAKLNPGKVLLYKILEELHRCRVAARLNLGTGTAEYRKIFATSSRRVVSVNIFRNQLYPQLLRALAVTADAGYRQLYPLIRRCTPPIKRLLRRRAAETTE